MGLLEKLSPSEVVGLLFAAGGLLFLLLERARLRSHPDARLAVTAFLVLCAGWLLTVLEAFFWGAALNFLEHACYALGTGLLSLWCWRRARRDGGAA